MLAVEWLFETERNGADIAFILFFVVIPVILFLAIIRVLKKWGCRSKVKKSLAGIVLLSTLLVYQAYIYKWLAWNTFYSLSYSVDRDSIKMVMRYPTREVTLNAALLDKVKVVYGGKGYGTRLEMLFSDGSQYRSPDSEGEKLKQYAFSISKDLGVYLAN